MNFTYTPPSGIGCIITLVFLLPGAVLCWIHLGPWATLGILLIAIGAGTHQSHSH